MATRRSFLSMVGPAPAALVTGTTDTIPGPPPVPAGAFGIPTSSDHSVMEAAARKWFQINGVPDFVREQVKERMKEYVHEHNSFDADLQAAKSFSLATKRRLQIERRTDRQINAELLRFGFTEQREGSAGAA